jgi:hypothetical protein
MSPSCKPWLNARSFNCFRLKEKYLRSDQSDGVKKAFRISFFWKAYRDPRTKDTLGNCTLGACLLFGGVLIVAFGKGFVKKKKYCL